MPDSQIISAGTASVPESYTVPANQEILIKTVSAQINGSGAGGNFVPVLEIDNGGAAGPWQFPLDTTITAGASVDVTWFPGGRVTGAVAGGGIQFDTDNVGGYLQVEATGTVAQSFSQPTGDGYEDATNFSQAFNSASGTVFACPASATNGAVLMETSYLSGGPYVNIHAGDAVAYMVGAPAPTVAVGFQGEADVDSGDAIGLKGIGAAGLALAVGVDSSGQITDSSATSADTAIGVRGLADAVGTGNAVGLQGQVTNSGTGAKTAILALDHTGAPIFEVRDDGSIHGLASVGAITWDL